MDPQTFAQNVQEKLVESFNMLKAKMTEQEVYAIFADMDASGQQKIGEIAPITKEMNSSLEIVMQSRKNNNDLNGLFIFNNTPKAQKADFCLRAKIGQDKGFALVQVTNANQMNINSSGQLIVSVNQRINLNENFKLVLQPNDFIIVALASLGVNQEQNINSTVSLIFKQKNNLMNVVCGILGLLLLLALLYVIYLCISENKKGKKITSDAPPPYSLENVNNAFYFF